MPPPAGAGPRTTRAPFGTLPDGRAVDEVTLVGASGLELRAITYGAVIRVLCAPDRAGRMADVVLGYDDLDGYLADRAYFGAVVGRYANRIARGRFTLDGHTHTLARNDGPNTLHGGVRGWHAALWRAEPFTRGDDAGVAFHHTSPDGDEGFPGTVEVRVTYTLTPRAELVVDYAATTDRATPLNVTQHSYWNLRGGCGTILDHLLTVDATAITPVDATLIPTGARRPVAGTPFDFRTPTPIGARIDAADEQLRRAGGYDHNWVLARADGGEPAPIAHVAHVARVVDPASGRTLDVATTEPGVQVYSGNFLDGTVRGKDGCAYAARAGLALETQHVPDSPNQPGFPTTILRPGRTFRSRTVFTLGTTG